MLLSFRGYLGEIQSEKQSLGNFHILVFRVYNVVSGVALPILKS